MCHSIKESKKEKKARWLWHECFCEVALHQRAEWTHWMGILKPVTRKSWIVSLIGAIFTQSFLIRNRALHSIESWTFTRCLFLQMDVFAMMQFAHRFAVYHNMALTHKIAHWWREAWDWDALSSDLACATFSWWDRSNSFKSLINHFNMCASLGSCACSLSSYILIILFFLYYDARLNISWSFRSWSLQP